MKKQFATLALGLFFISSLSFAQGKNIWYNANWQVTTKEKATFYRIPSQKRGKGYWFQDFYISGKKQMEGLSLKKDKEFYDGLVIWYYENGTIFQKVNYLNGYLYGKRLIYYENGNLKESLFYERGRKNKQGKEYYPDGRLKAQGKYLNDKKVGNWKRFYYDGVAYEN